MTIYAAKWVVPMDGPIIENGEVAVIDSRIEAVRPTLRHTNETINLGNSVLLPGLINAHTHLEYTALRGFLEDVAFFPWIRALNAVKANLTREDWVDSAKLGALECLASGITTIGDNTDSGTSLDAALWSGHRGRIYQEFFCIDHRTSVDDVLTSLKTKLDLLNSRTNDRLQIGISPHATYTINPAMFKAFLSDSRFAGLPISIHVAESPAESSLTASGTGPFAEMFERRGIIWKAPGTSPTQYVYDQGAAGNHNLFIHCVHQNENDINLVAHSGTSIIHCPKSNAKLGAGVAPLTAWLKTPGLKLGIGTDSAVSNNSHDLFEEMRFALLLQRGAGEMVEGVKAVDLLSLATSRGAEALGLSDEIGTLTPGKKADLIAVSLDGLHMSPASHPINSVVYSARASDVTLTVIDGKVCYQGGDFIDKDAKTALAAVSRIQEKLSMVEN